MYFIALIPGIAIALYIYFKDKYEPEPLKLVFVCFGLGIVCFILNAFLDKPIDTIAVGISSIALKDFIEELCIFIILIGLVYRNKDFNEPLDGIVYAVMVAMGFVTAKNINSIFSAEESGMVWSMLSSVLSHAAYAVLMGYFLGKAKFKMQHQTGYIIGALALPFIFHFMYDIIQLLSIFSGAWIGLIASLLIIVFLGKQAVDSYQKESPFKKK